MALFENFPYTNFHEMNLDWILQELKSLVDAWDSFGGSVTATAHTSSDPEVTVSGDLKDGLAFDFGLVQGPRGLTGIQGPVGPQGPVGSGLEILDRYATLTDLQAAHPTGNAGDMYLIGSGGSYTLYIWSDDSNAWVDGGTLTSPAPYTSAPLMDGTASAGSSGDYARGDHVHPSDSSKLDVSLSDGVYAVESGAQTMLTASDIPIADALVKYDSVGDIATINLTASADITATGDISANDINAGNDISAAGDISATGSLSADSISITNNNILNSDALDSMETNSATHTPVGKIIGTDMLQLEYDAQNIPDIKLDTAAYNSDGTVSEDTHEVYFTDSFTINSADYQQTRIALAPASASVLGGVKAGTGVSIAQDGTISASSSAFTIDLLWTNSSPASSFAAQTISLDLSNYSMVFIEGKYATETSGASYGIIGRIGNSKTVIACPHMSSSGGNYSRQFTASQTGVYFDDGLQGGVGTKNDANIPWAIYGIK